jgi:hypothetical protein
MLRRTNIGGGKSVEMVKTFNFSFKRRRLSYAFFA